MNDVLLEMPASPPITEVHIWIGHYIGGGEGLLSGDFEMLGHRVHMPLMNSDKEKAEGYRGLALKIMKGTDTIDRIELRTFRTVEP